MLTFQMVIRKLTTILDRSYVSSVLQLLLEKGSAICDDIQKIVSSAKTREKLIKDMEKDGLLTISVTYKPRKTFHIKLTEKGREIATLLSRAEGILAGDHSHIKQPPTNHSTPAVEGDKVK